MRRKQAVSLSAIFAAYVAALKVEGRDPNDEAKARLAEVLASLGDVGADTVRPADIEELKATLAATPATGRRSEDGSPSLRRPATVNRYLQALKAAFNVAKRAGLVDANPAASVKLLRENNKRVREMSPDEEKAILTALEPSRRGFHTDLRPRVRFLTATGLR
ncbi:MAG: hypothetical protein NT031_19190, partial [Planctomycetota bacterium]|nr:hypothetical protein [Planctomycetota bacterium]